MLIKKPIVSMIHITKNMTNQRIDNFIKSKFYKIPKNTLYKIIRIGRIRVNKKRVKPCYKLQLGDILRIPPITQKTQKNKVIILSNTMKKVLLSYILYEDKYLIIINKPSGTAVHGGSGIHFGIIESFRLLKNEYKYLELIHRLDRDTSGILMLAKKKSCLRNIHAQFRQKLVKKKYIALVHGYCINNKITISKPLIKNKLMNGKKIITVNNNGKKSQTIFEVKKRFSKSTLFLITPKTGRTHQIRVHAAYAGHPIIFDNCYGNEKLDKTISQDNTCNKILLHAMNITFYHPYNNQKIHITAPLDNRFKKYLMK